jgi:Spy/CpxP family protein refolding chaperone
MNTLSKSLLALALAALMTAPAHAQQRRGGGGGGFGRVGVSMLLSNAGVQEELKLDDEQKSKIREIADEAREKYSATRDLEPQERMAKFRELSKEVEPAALKAASEVLKPEQLDRLHGIHYQVAGPAAFEDEDLQKKLKMTDEQKSAVEQIIADSNSEMRELFQPGGDRDEMMSKIREHRKETVSKIEAKMTDEQKADYAKLLGAPFELRREGFTGR